MPECPVLMLPGTLCTGVIFEQQIKALRPHSPGVEVVQFGRETSIDEMVDTVEGHLPRTTGVAMVGFSMGGMVAMAFTRRHPGRIDRLALINSNSHTELPERRAARSALLAEAAKTDIATIVEKYYLPRYLHRQLPQHREMIVRMAMELGPECFEAQVHALAGREDSTSTLRDLDCPLLILGSKDDVLCPPKTQVHMHRVARDSELVLLESCGHFSLLEQPEAVNRCLVDWYLR